MWNVGPNIWNPKEEKTFEYYYISFEFATNYNCTLPECTDTNTYAYVYKFLLLKSLG